MKRRGGDEEREWEREKGRVKWERNTHFSNLNTQKLGNEANEIQFKRKKCGERERWRYLKGEGMRWYFYYISFYDTNLN